jgi:ABC-2 type transport system permease protein
VIAILKKRTAAYGSFAAIVPKTYLAYRIWFFVGMILQVIAMTILVFFWRAVYANTTTIAGLDVQKTINYLLLANLFSTLVNMEMVFEFGYNLREGAIAHALLRPLDLQASYYVRYLTINGVDIILQIPMAVVATLVFGLRWPTDPLVWGAFIITALLGRTVLFFFDWILGCLTFYTTEVWGLGVLVYGAGLFFGGSLIPLVMMPGWLQIVVRSVPFAQALYVPMSVLSGIEPLSRVPALWLIQGAWIAGLAVFSRVFYNIAIRKITVQGG